jgi:hypothetical protein
VGHDSYPKYSIYATQGFHDERVCRRLQRKKHNAGAKTAIEFASLPGEFATVGKLSFIRKLLSHVELWSEKK